MAQRPHDLTPSVNGQSHKQSKPDASVRLAKPTGRPPVKVDIVVSEQISKQKRPHHKTKSAQTRASLEPEDTTSTQPVKVNVLVSNKANKAKKTRPFRQNVEPVEPDWLDEELNEELDEELDEDLDEAATEAGRLAKINVLVAPKPQRGSGIKSCLLTLMVVLGMAGAVVGGGWVAVQFIVNPGSVRWLSWMLPEWNRHALRREVIQTLAEIEAEAAAAERFLGTPLYLPATTGLPEDLLIPILTNSTHCSGGASSAAECSKLVEIRIYRPLPATERRSHPGSFQLMDRMSVGGVEESLVMAPFVTSPTAVPGSNRPLPLTTVSLIDGNVPEPSVWLHISGERIQGSTRIVYGKAVRYDPVIPKLYSLESWTSPAGTLPDWQQITGSEATELVVNQTVGLEPSFKVYQVETLASSTEPLRLEPISLAQSALDSRTYDNGLILARSGLWSTALQTLESLKSQVDAATWNANAQAQLDLIALHASVTKAQADRDWASPSQQILAQLVDGRWGRALELLQTAIRNGQNLSNLLAVDSDRIWRRVNAALQVNRNQPDVQIWGVLVLTARRDRSSAIAWLTQQNPTAETNTRALQALNLLDPQASSILTASHSSRMIGAAAPVSSVNSADWLQLPGDTPLTSTAEQAWYQIQLSGFHDGQRWRRSPFTDLNLPNTGTAISLWNLLGLTNRSPMQILVWAADGQPQTIEATVRAARVRGSELQLLAAAPTGIAPLPQSPQPLAMTLSTISWLEPSQQLTLAAWSQQQPDGGAAFLVNLWQELQQTGQVQSVNLTPQSLIEEVGQWTVGLIDLTGDGQLEAVFTFQPSLLSGSSYVTASTQAANQDATRTLIFSAQGQLIYSELSAEAAQFLVAIANPGDGTAALLTGNGQTYRLLRWSAQNQRFE
jgi:hypothetical protein